MVKIIEIDCTTCVNNKPLLTTTPPCKVVGKEQRCLNHREKQNVPEGKITRR